MTQDEGNPTLRRGAADWLRWYVDQPENTQVVLAFWAPGGALLAVNRHARHLLGWGDETGERWPAQLLAPGAPLAEAEAEARARGRWQGALTLAAHGLTLRAELTLRSDLPGLGPTLCLQAPTLPLPASEPSGQPWLVQHYEHLVRLSPALAVVANNTHFELVSQSWQTTLGYSEEELLRAPFRQLLHPDDLSVAQTATEQMVQHGGQTMSFETRCVSRDGSTRWLSWSALYEPGMQRFYGVAHDLTDQRALQARLREATEAAQAASRAKSQFLANTSHEIRTPLNAILNANELLLATDLDDEQHELVEIALLSGRGLQGLLSNVLDLFRIESGRFELEQSVFDPRRPLDEVLRSQRNRALDEGLDLELQLGPELPSRVIGDELRLRQIVGNLVDNALKFTDRGRVTVRLDVADEQLLLRVRDTGAGIAPEKLTHMFDSFSQADVSDTRRHGGAGLGLTICRELATRMGGSITVDSQASRGTCFEVRLPLVVPVARAPSNPRLEAAAAQPLRPLRVLVAEDNAFNARVLHKWLSKQGHSVVVVGDGVEACEQGRHGPWDLVLMDLQMPRRDGLEATRLLRRELGPSLPIVALTASAQQGEADRCREAGMDDYLTKPVPFERLARLLRSLAGD